jgi:hypothetical protein
MEFLGEKIHLDEWGTSFHDNPEVLSMDPINQFHQIAEPVNEDVLRLGREGPL